MSERGGLAQVRLGFPLLLSPTAMKRRRERIRNEACHRTQENASLRTQLSAQLSMLELRNAEKGNLVVELEELKQDYAAIENELEIATRAGLRGRGVGGEGEGEEGRDELEKVRFPSLGLLSAPSLLPPLKMPRIAGLVEGNAHTPLSPTRRTSTPTETAPSPSLSS